MSLVTHIGAVVIFDFNHPCKFYFKSVDFERVITAADILAA
jgi:hypothetical protein